MEDDRVASQLIDVQQSGRSSSTSPPRKRPDMDSPQLSSSGSGFLLIRCPPAPRTGLRAWTRQPATPLRVRLFPRCLLAPGSYLGEERPRPPEHHPHAQRATCSISPCRNVFPARPLHASSREASSRPSLENRTVSGRSAHDSNKSAAKNPVSRQPTTRRMSFSFDAFRPLFDTHPRAERKISREDCGLLSTVCFFFFYRGCCRSYASPQSTGVRIAAARVPKGR